VHVWRAGLPAFRELPALKPTDDELDRWFRDMGGQDAKAAFQGMTMLVRAPQAVKLLSDRIAPAPKGVGEARTVPQWIDDLGNKSFAIRTKATTALERLGPGAERELRLALTKARDLEMKRRIEGILERIAVAEPSAQEIMHCRAVEVVEAITTAAAETLLRRWSDGDPGAVLTGEARQALARLDAKINHENTQERKHEK
jgi:hypothetical protein